MDYALLWMLALQFAVGLGAGALASYLITHFVKTKIDAIFLEQRKDRTGKFFGLLEEFDELAREFKSLHGEKGQDTDDASKDLGQENAKDFHGIKPENRLDLMLEDIRQKYIVIQAELSSSKLANVSEPRLISMIEEYAQNRLRDMRQLYSGQGDPQPAKNAKYAAQKIARHVKKDKSLRKISQLREFARKHDP